MKLKRLFALFTACALAASLTACGSSDDTQAADNTQDAAQTEETSELSGSVATGGSTSVEAVIGALSESFMELNPDVDVTYDPTGSGAGITGAADGTLDLGLSSRDLKDEEIAEGLTSTTFALDGIAIIVNNENPVADLSLEQIKGLADGTITNWSEVGGPNEDIVLVTRPSSSGTRATFQKYALDGNEEASNASMETDDSGVLLQNVKDTKGAIGYVALSYLVDDPGVSTVAIDGVEPTLENTYSGKYPVWTYEHMYTKGEPNDVVAAFLEYIQSDDYGTQMEKLGYGVSSKMTVTEH